MIKLTLKSYSVFLMIVNLNLSLQQKSITKNMEKRGGGLLSIELKDKTAALDNYFQLHCSFETADAMGSNFINSCLEEIADTFETEAQHYSEFSEE